MVALWALGVLAGAGARRDIRRHDASRANASEKVQPALVSQTPTWEDYVPASCSDWLPGYCQNNGWHWGLVQNQATCDSCVDEVRTKMTTPGTSIYNANQLYGPPKGVAYHAQDGHCAVQFNPAPPGCSSLADLQAQPAEAGYWNPLSSDWSTFLIADREGNFLPLTQASAVGDPHLKNIYGEQFDLMRPGKVLLIHIPRGQPVEGALLVVDADAVQLGGQCADIYFSQVNITGAWADEVHAGGLRFDAHFARDEQPKWVKLGPVELKVTHGRTNTGTAYLNFHIKHLKFAGFDIGGLLGADDHASAAAPTEKCQKQLALFREAQLKSTGKSMAIGTLD